MRDTTLFAVGLRRLMELHEHSPLALSHLSRERDPDGRGVGKTPIKRLLDGQGGLTLRSAAVLAHAYDRSISEVIDLGRRALNG